MKYRRNKKSPIRGEVYILMYKSNNHHKKNDDIPLKHSIPPKDKSMVFRKPRIIITKRLNRSPAFLSENLKLIFCFQ